MMTSKVRKFPNWRSSRLRFSTTIPYFLLSLSPVFFFSYCAYGYMYMYVCVWVVKNRKKERQREIVREYKQPSRLEHSAVIRCILLDVRKPSTVTCSVGTNFHSVSCALSSFLFSLNVNEALSFFQFSLFSFYLQLSPFFAGQQATHTHEYNNKRRAFFSLSCHLSSFLLYSEIHSI